MTFEGESVIASKDWTADNKVVYVQDEAGAVPNYDKVLLHFTSGKRVLYKIIKVKPLLSPNKDFEFKHYVSLGKKWWKCWIETIGVVK